MKQPKPQLPFESPRLVAAQVATQVIFQHQSLATLLDQYSLKVDERDRALLQELVYGTLRFAPRLELYLKQLLATPLKAKDQMITALLLVGLYQLSEMRIPAHAVINETVKAVAGLKRPWAKGLVNAVLRQFQRQQERLMADLATHPVAIYAHPQWFIDKVSRQWPAQWQQLLAAANLRPPLTLRVNCRQYSGDAYRQLLEAAEIVVINQHQQTLTLATAVDVAALPHFQQGAVSVQDRAAQQAALLLAPQAGERILDACAAPGGKSGHLLEYSDNQILLTAIDSDAKRLASVKENLDRLQLQAVLLHGDASQPETWWDGLCFDAILLDAPCSATGVIRRHPDIKLLRCQADIDRLLPQQQALLNGLWPLLKSGGRLLYATCSLMAEENQQQIALFLQQHSDAREILLTPDCDYWRLTYGVQLLADTTPDAMDGFYYALLLKA
ncbi:MAG: 16S rRNA (cytosine(967)-C(5))-methyltransferase RsmB [Gammaproteobacteria bacterium]|nr:16S rRNA (cytosine(967)-C(5))-methyltransferase RsmB [Gammaproteobacteria bacterium]